MRKYLDLKTYHMGLLSRYLEDYRAYNIIWTIDINQKQHTLYPPKTNMTMENFQPFEDVSPTTTKGWFSIVSHFRFRAGVNQEKTPNPNWIWFQPPKTGWSWVGNEGSFIPMITICMIPFPTTPYKRYDKGMTSLSKLRSHWRVRYDLGMT